MKQLIKTGGCIFFAALILLVSGCPLGDDDKDDTFTNHKNFSIKVSNYTNTNVIAFYSTITEKNKIGGIPAGSTNHGLANNPNFFGSVAKQFKLVFVTEAQYKKNKKNLAVLANEYLTQMYIYWNGEAGDNDKVYEISGRLGGKYQILINNDSSFDVEFRVNGPNGPTLGFAPTGVYNTKLYVSGGEIAIFPVFKYLNMQREVVETIYPKREADNKAWSWSYIFEENTPPQILDLSLLLKDISKRSSGVAYLVIDNAVVGQTIGLVKGTSLQVTTLGTSQFNSGTSKTFMIEMETVDNATTFASSRQISNYSVRTGSGETFPIVDAEGKSTMTLKADMMYTVYVTGQPGSSSTPVKAVVEVREQDGEGAEYEHGPVAVEFKDLF